MNQGVSSTNQDAVLSESTATQGLYSPKQATDYAIERVEIDEQRTEFLGEDTKASEFEFEDDLFDLDITSVPEEAAPDPEAAELEKRVRRVVEHIRAESRAERLVLPEAFLVEPFSYTDEQIAEVFRQIADHDDYVGIVRTRDENTGKVYLHDEYILSVPYATIMLRKEANDPKRLVAMLVRENLELKLEPTPVHHILEDPLFEFSEETLMPIVEALLLDEGEYADIQAVVASNGEVCLYTTNTDMSEDEIQYRAEYVEVIAHEVA